MANIRIKQLGERTATNGVHFGMGLETRKLEPGEVVKMDEDSELFQAIYATGAVEITTEQATRPLTYQSVLEAGYCSPSFKALDPSQEAARDQARAEVEERLKLSERNAIGLKAANAAHAKNRAQKASKDVVANRREERLKKLKEMQDGETNTT